MNKSGTTIYVSTHQGSSLRSEVILFLDFDGVLHSDWDRTPIPFQRMPLITELLRGLPHVNVVLTTSWRETEPIEKLRLHFAEDLRSRVIGVTPVMDTKDIDGFPHALNKASRQAECEAWMWITGRWTKQTKPAWVAVDDRKWWFSVDCPWLVHINPKTALTEADFPRIRDLLELARRTDLAAQAAPKATTPDKT